MNRFGLLLAAGLLLPAVRADENEDESKDDWLEALTDLKSLTDKYQELKAKVKNVNVAGSKRYRIFEKQLTPVAKKIGKLDSAESYEFLKAEFQTGESSFAPLCGEAMLYSSNDDAVPYALKEYTKRPPAMRSGLLKGLGGTPTKLEPFAQALLKMAVTEKDPQVRQHLPAALGKLDTLTAAKVMFSAITKVKDRDSPASHAQLRYNDGVARTLGSSQNEKVRDWVESRAFKSSRSNPLRLEVAARAAGDLKLEATRQDLEKLLRHPDPFTAGAAAEALGKIGVDASLDKLIAALEKGKARTDLRFRARSLDAVATSDDPRALEFLLGMAGSKDRALRAIVLGSLASKQSPQALQTVLGALGDANPNVRSTALVALSRKRDKAMIAPLIAYLGTETHERLQIDALKLLVSLTGVNMELNVADWENWWKGAEKGFKLPEEVETVVGRTSIRRQTAEDVEIVPRYFGMPVVATNRAAFLVDVSGSMTEKVVLETGDEVRKIDALKKELEQVIKKLPEETYVNIIAFSHNYKPWKTRLVPLKGSGRQQALKYVSTLQAASATNVYDTLEFALRDRNVDTIFLLSDGEPTAGRYTDVAEILREVEILNRSRSVSINGISFGEESELLRELARENNGEYKFVKTQET